MILEQLFGGNWAKRRPVEKIRDKKECAFTPDQAVKIKCRLFVYLAHRVLSKPYYLLEKE